MADPHPVVSYSKTAKFEDVRDDLKLAIEAKGLVIDYESFVNRMLERTGKDVGSSRKLYADAQAFVFCSAALSRKTMEADPTNISLCPYSMWFTRPRSSPGRSMSLTSGPGVPTDPPLPRRRSRKWRRFSTASRAKRSAYDFAE
jgi:hypothetical protein